MLTLFSIYNTCMQGLYLGVGRIPLYAHICMQVSLVFCLRDCLLDRYPMHAYASESLFEQ